MAKRNNRAVPQPQRREIKFLTQAQADAYQTIADNRITFLLGASGAGKSQIAFAYAVQETFKETFEKVIVTRPCIEAAGESLGYLKGTVDEKTAPYVQPALAVAKKVGYLVPIEFMPIGFMRGHTFENCVVVADEAQNMNVAQLKLVLSRLGPGSKIILCGDSDQKDVRDSGLEAVADVMAPIHGVGVFRFQVGDIVRDPLIGKILAAIASLGPGGSV